jgi:hypothetical protein
MYHAEAGPRIHGEVLPQRLVEELRFAPLEVRGELAVKYAKARQDCGGAESFPRMFPGCMRLVRM